jgi:hypothetical protein
MQSGSSTPPPGSPGSADSERNGCPSDATLHALREGQLADRAALEVEDHLRQCRACRQRAHTLEDDALDAKEAKQAEEDAARRAAQPPGRGNTRRQRLVDMLVGGVLAAGVATAAYLLLPKRPSPEDAVRVDGAARLRLQVERDEGWVDGRSGEVLSADDTLRVTFQGTETGHLTLLTIDPSGEVTAEYPSSPSAARWTPGEQSLPTLRLDGGAGPYALVAILCPQPIEVSAVRSALAKAASTPERFALLTCTLDMVRVTVR